MKLFFTILILGLLSSASGQKQFDSLNVEQVLSTNPKQLKPTPPDQNILKAIEAVDRKYRQIVDTLFYYKSRRHTIFQTVLIKTNDSISINPLTFGDKLKTSNIIFNNEYLNAKIDSLARPLSKEERDKLYEYLKNNYDNFSMTEKKINAQPVRIKYIMFPNNFLAQVGIDIYGTHFLWTIDKINNWDVIKVERLWVY